ncbi:BMC domain-containing protein [Tessaracoccus lacteus]|uniref:BMC domain-containing protein n=1 Tax=Tessaracoccus lacteus TaxID=3041766 RepID=UPI003F693C77
MQALGLIEVVGLAAGFEAADVACKSANVDLVGYELAKGGGFVTIKVLGQVGAVSAAIDAAAVAAAKINRVVSKLVIPRPNDQIEPLVGNKLTRGWTAPTPPPEPEPVPTAVLDSDVTEVVEDTPQNTADEQSAAPKTRPATTARKTAAAKATTGRK